jgi:hypothetical protein
MANTDRVPSGVPTGGEFAAHPKPDSAVALLDEPKQPGEYSDVTETNWVGREFTRSVNTATGFDDDEFTTITNHYMVAVLWTSQNDGEEVPEGEDELDGSQTIYDISPAARAAAEADLFKFMSENKVTLDQVKLTEYGNSSGDASGLLGQIGHDFWLTRNGEGTGFWDRPELRANGLGETLSESARQFAEQSAWCENGVVGIE